MDFAVKDKAPDWFIYIVLTWIALVVFFVGYGIILTVSAVEIPVTVRVLNAEPEVLQIWVVPSPVGVGSPFQIHVKVRDNNTLEDILWKELVIDGRHLTPIAVTDILNVSYGNRSVPWSAVYIFRYQINASTGDLTARVCIGDEAINISKTFVIPVWRPEFSLTVLTQQLSVALKPGGTASTRITALLETNVPVDLYASQNGPHRCTLNGTIIDRTPRFISRLTPENRELALNLTVMVPAVIKDIVSTYNLSLILVESGMPAPGREIAGKSVHIIAMNRCAIYMILGASAAIFAVILIMSWYYGRR